MAIVHTLVNRSFPEVSSSSFDVGWNRKEGKEERIMASISCSTFGSGKKEGKKLTHLVARNQHKCKHTRSFLDGDDDHSNWIIIQPDKPTNCSFGFSKPTKKL